jgi:DNA-binding transcriptional ArsR family regulator
MRPPTAPEGRAGPPRTGRGPEADALFAALGDPTRRRLLDRLARDGPLTATQLAPAYPISRQALVKHLASLSDAGLVEPWRVGREVRYGVVAGGLDDAAAWLASVGDQWDRRLGALRRHLET